MIICTNVKNRSPTGYGFRYMEFKKDILMNADTLNTLGRHLCDCRAPTFSSSRLVEISHLSKEGVSI